MRDINEVLHKLAETRLSCPTFIMDELERLYYESDENGMATALLEADLLATKNELAERDRTIAHLRKSLEATLIPFKFYADPHTYDPAHLDKLGYIIIDEDGGASAKDALAAVLRALGRE